MSDNEVIEIRRMLTTLVEGQAKVAQSVDDLKERLYNHGSGAIPTLFASVNALKESTTKLVEVCKKIPTVETVADNAARKAESVATSVSIRHAYTAGYGAAIATVLTLLGKWLLSKAGIHF